MGIPLPPETLNSFAHNELQARVFLEKYSLRGPDGQPTERTPQEMWDRVATGLAAVETTPEQRDFWRQEFRWLLGNFRFLPGGRVLHAIGQTSVGRKAVPVNCFVLKIKGDTLADIYECAKEMAITYSRGGGVGVDISALRPKDSVVHNAAHKSTGAVSFMETFSLVTGTIGQSGRRGALMLTIRDDHPDVLDFVKIKRNKDKVRFANISVLVSDAFMQAVKADTDWHLHYENPEANVFVEQTIRARSLWNVLIEGARDWAEPGCLFIDTARRRGTTEYNDMQVLTTNPCCPAGTRVAVPTGWKPVEQVEIGDHIVTVDGIRHVTRVDRYSHVPVYRVEMSDGGTVRATAAHQFHAARAGALSNGFTPIRLDALQPGDAVRTLNGAVRIVSITPNGIEDVYDLYEPETDTWITEGYVSRGCGEQFLDPYSSCNLGAINLLAFAKQPFAEIAPADNVDWDNLTRAVRASVRFLDNVITYSDPLYPLEGQRQAARHTRRIGLGITGLGDLLVTVGLRYDTDEAIEFTKQLMKFLKLEAYRASADLAQEKGPFPAFDPDQHLAQEFFQDFPQALLARIREVGLRNAALMTVAPTGSISAMAGITSGIEPIFALTYQRRSESLSQGHFTVTHPLIEAYFKATNAPHRDLHTTENPNQALREALPTFFVTSHELDPMQRVRMQAAIASQIDNSVSTTVNLPEDVSKETVAQIYQLAWELGCKGITVYREHSRENILSTTPGPTPPVAIDTLADRVTEIAKSVAPSIPGRDALSPEQHIEAIVRTLAERLSGMPVQLSLVAPSEEPLLPRPESLSGMTHRVRTRMGTMFVTVNELDGQPVEVFCRLGKGGTHAEADSEMAGRLISFALRVQTPSLLQRLELIAEQLEGIGGGESVGFGPNRVKSIADGVAKGLYKHLVMKRGVPVDPDPDVEEDPMLSPAQDPAPVPAKNSNGDLCPQCHQYTLITDQGCTKCRECSHKEC